MSASVYKPEEAPCFLLFKRIMENFSAKRLDGHSLHLRVKVGDVEIDFDTEPPPTIVGGGRGGGPPAVFDKAKVQVIIQEYPDFLNFHEEGGKVTVSTKKFLDKEWETINGKLKAAGMRYSRDNRRWEQA